MQGYIAHDGQPCHLYVVVFAAASAECEKGECFAMPNSNSSPLVVRVGIEDIKTTRARPCIELFKKKCNIPPVSPSLIKKNDGKRNSKGKGILSCEKLLNRLLISTRGYE
jgi:hypothetical protein